jgi:hypothetical protein
MRSVPSQAERLALAGRVRLPAEALNVALGDHVLSRIERKSVDGQVEFSLLRTSTGIHVERSIRLPQGGRTHLVHFENEAIFSSWCKADRLWLRYPHLLAEVERSGRALFSHELA